MAQKDSQVKALVIAPAWIGDAIMAQPLFIRLHENIPGLHLDALASPWVAPVLQRMPQINEIIENPFGHGVLELTARYRFAQTIATKAYQQVYVLPNSLKSGLIPFFSRIPERIGFTGEARYGLINCRHDLDKIALPQMAERFAQLAQKPGTSLIRPLPPLSLQSSIKEQADVLNELGLSKPEKLITLCPGAEFGPAKRWPAAHFARLADLLSEQGFTLCLLGSKKDAPIGEEIIQAAPSSAKLSNLCGRTSLSQAIDLIAQSELVVCNDSGLMHVAAALHRPLIAIYGSSSPDFTPPLTAKAHIIRSNLACSPCFKRQCPLGHLNCLNHIAPQQVFEDCMKAAAKENQPGE